MSRCPKRRLAGFTLIEVLIAFVILAVSSLALYRGMSAGLSGTEASEARITATLLARSKLDEVGATIPVEPGTQRGTSDGFGWAVAIAPFFSVADPATGDAPVDDAAVSTSAYRIVVTVVDRHGYPVTLTSWRLGPTL